MKKKLIIIGFMLFMMFSITGCGNKNQDALKFKEEYEYESLNGTTNGLQVHRTVHIDSDNPFVYITAEELVQKLNNEETFYVYFGSKSCPWCRSVIEKSIEIAKQNHIETIYYVDIWDDDGNEILRDKYVLSEDNELEKTIQGTDAYYEIMRYFDEVLNDYTLTDSNGMVISVSEKRIFAPSFIYVENGLAKRITTGTSDKQTDSRGELTEEILQDEEELFINFFHKN